jgi:hypothetical protein
VWSNLFCSANKEEQARWIKQKERASKSAQTAAAGPIFFGGIYGVKYGILSDGKFQNRLFDLAGRAGN